MKRIFPRLLALLALSPCLLHALDGDENWEAGFVLPPGLDGEVYAIATVGSNLYVGGSFLNAGDVLANSIARWDGTNWSSLESGIHGVVYALASQGTNLYVGGKFDRAGSAPAINLACWNGAQWQQIGDVAGTDSNSSAGPDFGLGAPRVVTLVATTNRLIIGGNFRQAGTVAATNIAALDGTNWTAFGAGLGGLGGEVHAMAQFRGQLYAGGAFINSGNMWVTNVARWTGTNWRAVGPGLIGPTYTSAGTNRFRGVVNALAVQKRKLFAGGQVDHAGKKRLINLASWNGLGWTPVRRGVGATNGVDSVENIVISGRYVYITGSFQSAGAVASANIIRWNGLRWFSMAGGLGGAARPVAILGTNVYVGGLFGLAGNVGAAYVACWNAASNTWTALGEGVGNTLIENAVTLAASGNSVFCAGPIETAGTNRAHNVAAWSGSNWVVIDPGFVGTASSSAVVGTNYYVSGQFIIPQVGATNLACWNGSNWLALPPLRDAASNATLITVMAATSNQLYVAGNFVSAGGLPVTNVAAWSGSNWSSVGAAPAAMPLSGTQPMIADAQYVYVLTTVTNNSGTNDVIYRSDGTNWVLLGAPNGAGHIRSLSVYGGFLHAISTFDQTGDLTTTKMDRYNGSKWEAVNWPFGQLAHVPLMAATDRYLYAGGPWDFTASSSPGISRFDGANWAGLGSGLVDSEGFGNVIALATSGRRVYVAGYFRTAGGKPSYRFAIWNEP